MTVHDSFKQWLISHINKIFQDQTQFILWVDSQNQWREILLESSERNFQLWIVEEHELKTRYKIENTVKNPRVIYIPKSREELTYLKVYEHQAAKVIQTTLVQALAEYGVLIPRETQEEIQDQLPTLVKEWLDKPLSHWRRELTTGTVRDTIVDNETILETLTNKDLSSLPHEKQSLFRRRITEELGLPDPTETDSQTWRTRALAGMLYTEATQLNPQDPPLKTDRTIEEPQREKALKLLYRWSKRIDLVPRLQELIKQADETASLRYWAQSQQTLPKPLMSRQVEAIFFQKETQKINQHPLNQIIIHLKQNNKKYQEHSEAFWGNPRYVDDPIPWRKLAELTETAIILHHNQDTHKTWKTTQDAVNWYTQTGWKIDHAAENLFINQTELPGQLLTFRATLQRHYTRFLDHVNQTFSEMVAAQGLESIKLPYPGELTQNHIKNKETTAFLILDALRYELGQRLAEKINKVEPVTRAKVKPSIAPIPTITELGMAFTLPGAPMTIKPQIQNNKWVVSTPDPINLAIKSRRLEWLKKNYKLKDSAFLNLDELLSKQQTQPQGKHVFIFGREIDLQGHDGQLEIFGAEDNLERYTTAIRKLRDTGYTTIIVSTDHGYFHWNPETDEIQDKPEGNILWTSRRAIVGEELTHRTALKTTVSGNPELDCIIPRSINAFRTYGGLGFFHGGATLQELIIPTIIIEWPKKARKTPVILKPIQEITSLSQRVEISSPAQTDLTGKVDEKTLSRSTFIKVINPENGSILFKSLDTIIKPGARSLWIELKKLGDAEAERDTKATIMICDSDNEEILDQTEVTLKVSLDEWY